MQVSDFQKKMACIQQFLDEFIADGSNFLLCCRDKEYIFTIESENETQETSCTEVELVRTFNDIATRIYHQYVEMIEEKYWDEEEFCVFEIRETHKAQASDFLRNIGAFNIRT